MSDHVRWALLYLLLLGGSLVVLSLSGVWGGFWMWAIPITPLRAA